MRINLDLNKKKDMILLDLTFYSYPKQLDAMIHIYTDFECFFLKNSLLLIKPAFI